MSIGVVCLLSLLFFFWFRNIYSQQNSELNNANQQLMQYIAEHQRTEKALLKSEHLLTTSQKMASVGSFVIDLETRTWTGTPEAYRICGIDETYPHTLDDLLQLVHPEWREELTRKYFQILTGSNHFDFEHKIIRAHDQNERWIHLFITIEHDEQLKPMRLVVTIQDITRRKEIENRLQIWSRAVEQSPVSIVVTNLAGDIEYANQKATETTGYTKEELIGNNPRVLKSGITTGKEYEELWNNLSVGNEWKMFFHNKRKNGELYWESANIFPIIDSYGEITHYMAIKEDVTEIVNKENELQKLKIAIEQSPVAMIITDLHANIQYASPAFEKITGYTAEEVIGENSNILQSGKTSRELYGDLWKTISSGKVWKGEWENRKKNGELHDENISITPIFNEKGEITNYLAIKEDITERKRAEKFLQDSNMRTQKQRAALSEFVMDESFVSGEITTAMQRITQVTSECLSVSQVSIWTFSDDNTEMICRSQYEAEHNRHSKGAVIKKQDSPYYFEALYRDRRIAVEDALKDPRTNELAESYLIPTGVASLVDTVFVFEGKMAGIICLEQKGEKRKWYPDEEAFADRVASLVAQLFANEKRKQAEIAMRQSEKQFKTLFMESPIGMTIYDIDSREIIDANPIARSFGMHAMQKIDEWFLSSNHSSETVDWIGKAAIEGPQQFEWHMHDANGEISWKGIRLKTLEIDGEVRGMVTAVDLTKQKQAEEDRVAREAAEEANRAKSAFLSNMSHEIRTPLNAIIGFAQILKKDASLAPKQAEQVQTILRSGEHLIKLINDILDLSKIEAGFLTLSLTDFSVHDLLKDIEMMFTLRTRDKGLEFLVDIEKDVPEFVTGDEAKLRQVFINLLGNAVKFTTEGGIYLRAFIEDFSHFPDNQQEFRLLIEVEDTGDGISDQDKERIFHSFYQAEDGKKAGGTGLGLAISKDLIELMGGELTLQSEKGKGSTFRFFVPLKTSSKRQNGQKSVLENVIGLEIGSGPFRILVVDDVKDNRDLLIDMLKPIGFQVQEACNGQEAIEIFERWSPHAVIMDMRMPVMDGYEATRKIKATAKGEEALLIALTASALDSDAENILATGADDFLSKPFRAEELFAILSKVPDLRYIFADIPQQTTTVVDRQLTHEDIASLPADLVQSMYHAVEQGNMGKLRESIVQVEQINESIASQLQRLAKKYDYEKLMILLQNKGD